MVRLILNAVSAKNYSGGVFQIAVNFFVESLAYEDDEIEWYYFASEELDAVIGDRLKSLPPNRYYVFPTQPDLGSYWSVRKQLRMIELEINPDVIYTVAAPCYFFFRSKEVLRFTNPWILTSNKYAWSKLSARQRIRTVFYRCLQKRLICKSEYFITQTETLKNKICEFTRLPEEQVQVINNVLPKVYVGCNTMRDGALNDHLYNIAAIAAPFPHKNLDIIPYVLKDLRDEYGICNIRFHITVDKNLKLYKKIVETAKKFKVEDCIISHGRVSQIELVDIYRRCNMALIPTLLEVFSAAPLEAMFFNLNIVASDFDFNREVMGDAALYYIPTNHADAAKMIKRYIDDMQLCMEKKELMTHQLIKYMSYDDYMTKTVRFLKAVAKINNA